MLFGGEVAAPSCENMTVGSIKSATHSNPLTERAMVTGNCLKTHRLKRLYLLRECDKPLTIPVIYCPAKVCITHCAS